MTGILVGLPVLLPLLAAGLSLMLAQVTQAQRLVSSVVLAAVLVDAVALAIVVDRTGPVVLQAGGYRPPFGITLVADRLSALLLVVSILVIVAVLVYAVGQRVTDYGRSAMTTSFHPIYLVLASGVALAYLTGDLFNLFVAFEVMLAASYVLITRGVTAERVRPAITYVIVSLTSSLLFITLVALVYAATGTVTLADLADKVDGLEPGMRMTLAVLVVMVFGIKAALVPLHFWLPDSYPTAPAPVTAVFAALLTKVALYAILRTQTTVFAHADAWSVLLVLGAVTMMLGVLGAVAQDDLNRMMSFLLVSHIGFMLFGLGLFNEVAMTGTIVYILHHIVVQAALFLVLGLVTRHAGTASLARIRGLGTRWPMLGVLYAVAGLSLAGLPPLSGFVAKVTLLRGGVDEASAVPYAASAVLVLASFLTLYALARVWVVAFWGESGPEAETGRQRNRAMTFACGSLVAFGVLIAAGAGPVSQISERAAAGLLDNSVYRTAVLGGDR